MKNFLIYICLIIILGFSMACNSNDKDKNNAEKYPCTKPILVDTVLTSEYVAEIQSLQNVEIRPKINGFIEKIHVDEGQNVYAGQLLFTLNSQTFQKDLLKAKIDDFMINYKKYAPMIHKQKISLAENFFSGKQLYQRITNGK